MTLRELIEVASRGYECGFAAEPGGAPLSSPLDYVDAQGNEVPDVRPADTLALFITRAIHDVYDADADPLDQLSAVAGALEDAATDLLNAARALDEEMGKRMTRAEGGS